MGPYGEVDTLSDYHIERLARDEGLTVQRNVRDGGLLEEASALGLANDDGARLSADVLDFYLRTSSYDLEFWSEWNPAASPGGRLICWLYSNRLEQLNLPQRPLDASRGMRSEIIKLLDPLTGETRYTYWHRILKRTGKVLYSGMYETCVTPDGRTCLKVVFPLPRGNATVVLDVTVGEDGRLVLRSEGERFGDPGFYFLLRDARDRHWAQYIRSFRERIEVYVDEEGVLRGDHVLTLFKRRVLELHYRMRELTGDHAAHASHTRPKAASG